MIKPEEVDEYPLRRTADDDIRRLLARVDQRLLYAFLRAAPAAVTERVVSVLTPRIAALVREDLEEVAMPTAGSVSMAQGKIAENPFPRHARPRM